MNTEQWIILPLLVVKKNQICLGLNKFINSNPISMDNPNAFYEITYTFLLKTDEIGTILFGYSFSQDPSDR